MKTKQELLNMNKKLQTALNKIHTILCVENLYADGVRLYTAKVVKGDILLSNGTGLDISLADVASGKVAPKFTNGWGSAVQL